jgi:hypothetical protein
MSSLTSLALLHIDESRAHAFLGNGSDNNKLEGWYLDSGTTHHMTKRVGHFADLDHSIQGSIKFSDESAMEICGIRFVVFMGKTGKHKLLHGVYYISTLQNSIISLDQLNEGDLRVEIDRGVLRIWDRCGHLLAKVNRRRNWFYVLHMEVAQPLYLAAHRDDEAWRWHELFWHLHFEVLQKLGHKQMVHMMAQIDHVEQLCDTCMVNKHKQQPLPRHASYHALKQLDLLHGDLYGPIMPVTPGGRR